MTHGPEIGMDTSGIAIINLQAGYSRCCCTIGLFLFSAIQYSTMQYKNL